MRSFWLVPGFIQPDATPQDVVPSIAADVRITMTDLVQRQAWQIDENDPDSVAIFSDDDPIIPEGVDEPPVYRALARKKRKPER